MEAEPYSEPQSSSVSIQNLLIEAFYKAHEVADYLVPSGIRACAIATLKIAQDPVIEDRMEELFASKRQAAQFPTTFGPSYLFNGWVRSHQEQMIDKPDYPRYHTFHYGSDGGQARAVERWEADLRRHLTDDAAFDRLKFVYGNLPTMSNISERYKDFAVLIQLMRERFNREITVLDVGGSLGDGSKKLMVTDDELKLTLYRPTEIIHRPDNYDPYAMDRSIDPTSVEIDQPMSDRFNILQNRNNHIKEAVSADTFDVTNPIIRRWVRSNRYPDELKDPTIKEHDALMDQIHPQGLKIVRVNFSEPDEVADIMPLSKYRGYFDFAFLCLSMYQSSTEAGQFILQHVDERVNDDGLYSVKDFAGKVRGQPDKLQFYDYWLPYSLSTFVWDKRNPGSWEQIFDSENGRSTRLNLSLGQLAVRNTPRSVEDMIEAAL